MAALNRNSRLPAGLHAAWALLAVLIAAPVIGAEPGQAEWGADAVTSDFRKETVDLSGNVRVTQGPMSIEADKATARGDLRSDDSRWTFEKSVRIRTAEADLQSNSASAQFVNGQIADARVEGSPAQFEQRGGPADRRVRGRAGVIEYDFGAGIVKLTDQVWFSNGTDEFRGDVVIYNIREQRVQINPGGKSSSKVRGIIRPRERAGQTPSTIQKGSSADTPTTDERTATESGA